jgi:hypothetical protein
MRNKTAEIHLSQQNSSRPNSSTLTNLALLAAFTMLVLLITISPPFSVGAQDATVEATQQPEGVSRPEYDFTGDNKTDFTVLAIGATGSPITWKVLRNPAPAAPNAAFIRVFDFGLVGDSITAGDYVGDAKTDVSVWRTGNFYHSRFPEGTGPLGPVTVVNWGMTGDIVGRVGNYDVANTKDDETIIRIVSSVLQWHIRGSQGTNRVVPFGRLTAGFTTLAFQGADFTADGRDELVICHVNNANGIGQWMIGDSITGNPILILNFGNFNTDFFLNPDDYTGDSIADIPTWRGGGADADAGFWYVLNITNTSLVHPLERFGIPDATFVNNDLPLRGDYDGDGIADRAVFRPINNTWYWKKSSDDLVQSQQWGQSGDVPLPNFFTF